MSASLLLGLTLVQLHFHNRGFDERQGALALPIHHDSVDRGCSCRGRILDAPKPELGSIIIVLATDAPMLPHQLQRLARRAAIGFGRNGTYGGNSWGDIFLAFSMANAKPLPQLSPAHLSMDHINDSACDPVYLGAVECTEEAVINAMLAAESTPELRPGGSMCEAIDHADLMRIMARHGRVRASDPDMVPLRP